MNAPHCKLLGGMLIATIVCLAAAFTSHAQTTAASRGATTKPAPPVPAPAPSADELAEREAIWNSPNMLRARAWLQEYCATSKRCKPGDAEKFSKELENMSATQMKLWLMKFDEEEDQRQQQQAFWKQAHTTALNQAKSADKATQKSYAAIETEESQAAQQDQSQIEEQEKNEQTMQDDKQLGPYTPYGQGMYPGAGLHYHFHIYPY